MTRDEQILSALADGAVSTADLAERTGLPARTIQHGLHHLTRTGHILSPDRGVYRLSARAEADVPATPDLTSAGRPAPLVGERGRFLQRHRWPPASGSEPLAAAGEPVAPAEPEAQTGRPAPLVGERGRFLQRHRWPPASGSAGEPVAPAADRGQPALPEGIKALSIAFLVTAGYLLVAARIRRAGSGAARTVTPGCWW